MVSRLQLIVLIPLLLLCSFSAAALTRLSASIDKNPVMANESFILTIEADADMLASKLRTDQLLKDFVVGKTSSSRQTQIINGNVKRATTWTVMLISRTPGKYVIPAFTIDGVSSQPIAVTIIPATAKADGTSKNVFLETSVDKASVYLQSSIQFTTKLYLAVDIQRGSLTEPTMENANIRQIGKDEEMSEIKDGIRYRVIKRLYAITPQRSGSYKIKAPIFNGELVMNKRRSFFSGFNNTKPVSLLGDDIEITVNPIPDEYDGQWLPSEFVALQEEWQPTGETFTVGDPITRIITLTAMGVAEEQLPELTVNYPADVKTYPDQSTLNSATRNNQLIAQRKDSVALVPGKAGKVTLPEVRIPWWNTKINRMEFATLPAKTFNILPSANAAVPPLATLAPATVPLDTPATIKTEFKEIQVNSYLTWAFLTAWILTTLMWLAHVRSMKITGVKGKRQTTDNGTSGRTYWTKFEAACKANNASEASNQLMRWGRARWPEQSFTCAMDVVIFLGNNEAVEAVKALQSSLYGAQGGSWKGQNLLKLVAANKSPKVSKDADGLRPLHPA